MEIKGIISENTIVLLPVEGEQINISKETDRLLYEEVTELIENGDVEKLYDKYVDIKGAIERFSHKIFTVDNTKGQLMLKGDDVPMPDAVVNRLVEMKDADEDFMPLIRFWKKLKNNTQEVREQLYSFMLHNNIPLTEAGDIVTEKGVSIRDGKLVDSYTNKIDNSIGAEVTMDRGLVDADPNRTCSRGLHVGAPDYVRRWYSQETIIQCIVSPEDVVSIPVDYDNTKMRVCRYRVAGYSTKTDNKPVFRLDDFVTVPNEYIKQRLSESKGVDDAQTELNLDTKVVLETSEELSKEFVDRASEEIKDFTANEILDYVEDVTGVRMAYNPKSKRTIVKRGIELLAIYYESEA